MKKNIWREVSHDIPHGVSAIDGNGAEPLLTAYGCVLMERDVGKSYIYTAVNIKTGKREVISRRSSPLTTSGVEPIVEKIRNSKVAGAGRYEAERVFGDALSIGKCHEMIDAIFKEALPQHGYVIRNEQVSLSHHIMEAISRRTVSLSEAGVGIGKTLAYLIPAIIAKRGMLGGYWNMSFHTGSPYIEMADMPIVVATSSIALQKAIMTDYIPELSKMLLEYGVIKTPLTSMLRKGREHYICLQKLQNHMRHETDQSIIETLKNLFDPDASIDLADSDGLTPYIKRRICVPSQCPKQCPARSVCPYLQFREEAGSPGIDIQVCNHNYFLADTIRRREGKRPLIRNYQMVIIDEAHKFLQAALAMYGTEMSSNDAHEMLEAAKAINFKHEKSQVAIMKAMQKLFSENKRFFKNMVRILSFDLDGAENEPDCFSVVIGDDAAQNMHNIRRITGWLINKLEDEPVTGKGDGRKTQLISGLMQLREQAFMLANSKRLICWLETAKQSADPALPGEMKLCATPKNIGRCLYDDLWGKGIPAILTSGTLSVGGNFSRIKKALGIDRLNSCKVTETTKPSPFNYRENSLLYISKDMPYPDQRDPAYISAAAEDIEKLVKASNGHAVALFTSYKAMDMTWGLLSKRKLPYPLFRLDKGGVLEIERFKKSGNGIMFAAGALWEGIDIPGDALSMLIIVRLPFPVPDPITEYERTKYPNISEFMEHVIKPDMCIKLKQGHGRGLRTESDTCVIAILDIRASEKGAYHETAVTALPECSVTDSISDVKKFYATVKPASYFMECR